MKGSEAKKTYQAPRLRTHGTVQELTGQQSPFRGPGAPFEPPKGRNEEGPFGS